MGLGRGKETTAQAATRRKGEQVFTVFCGVEGVGERGQLPKDQEEEAPLLLLVTSKSTDSSPAKSTPTKERRMDAHT